MPPHKSVSRRGFLQQVAGAVPEPRSSITPITNPFPIFFIRPAASASSVDSSQWMLTVFHEEQQLALLPLSDIRNLPSTEHIYTIACESSHARNLLLGTAGWRGVRIMDFMAQVQISANIRSLKVTSNDGFSCLLPLEQLDHALLAYDMNDEPLTVAYGAPLRLIVPGALGSHMPKWIRSLSFSEQVAELVIPMAPTSAHLLTPHHRHSVIGPQHLTGIAYAGNRTLHTIEISIDGADWAPIPFVGSGQYAWVTWSFDWNPPTPADYHIQVRAQDTFGAQQGLVPAAGHDMILRVME
jgi:DMSO/TMAO reductase YedYZ molybdopterin-dependent catalytic subunit